MKINYYSTHIVTVTKWKPTEEEEKYLIEGIFQTTIISFVLNLIRNSEVQIKLKIQKKNNLINYKLSIKLVN